MKELFKKYREIIVYIIVGLMTTAVAYGIRLGIIYGFSPILGIDLSAEGGKAAVLRTVAVSIGWVAGVIFAFFTNKKWVFNDTTSDRRGVARQLAMFAGGRVATLGLDYLLNWGMLWVMGALALKFLDGFLGISLDTYNELVAWFVTQVAVVASNYFISKLFVFRGNKTQNEQDGDSESKKTEN